MIGRPFVAAATLQLPNGKHFSIRTDGLSDGHPYLGRVTLNGKVLTRSYLRHEEIVAGGELRYTMQAQPDRRWAHAPADRPYSLTPYRP